MIGQKTMSVDLTQNYANFFVDNPGNTVGLNASLPPDCNVYQIKLC